jgi:hypothetical protein
MLLFNVATEEIAQFSTEEKGEKRKLWRATQSSNLMMMYGETARECVRQMTRDSS